jgi:hypothetical protein
LGQIGPKRTFYAAQKSKVVCHHGVRGPAKQEFAENVSDEVLTDTDSERVVDYRQGGNRKAGLRPSGQVV